MRNVLLLILAVFLFAGAGCISSSQDFGQVPDGESVKEEAVAPTADEGALSMTTYRTSGKVVLLFDAPNGWFVRQSDGGGFSSVTIRETKMAQAQASITIEQPWPDDDGHRATYDEWLILRGLTQPAVGSVESDMVRFDVWEAQEKDALVYTWLMDQQTPRFLRVSIPTAFDEATSRAIVRSINPVPTPSEQDAAVPTSEWTAADTRE